jgi:hypothetical protein
MEKISAFLVLTLFLFSVCCTAQDFFEEALNESGEAEQDRNSMNVDLNGYVRAGIFVGENGETDDPESKSTYGEASLKLEFNKDEIGDGFFELRFKQDEAKEEDSFQTEFREAYLNVYLGSTDIRAGKQIVVWGKADGFNPTNTITPVNYRIYSPIEDDRREGNTLVRVNTGGNIFRLEGIWVPKYKASELPLSEDKLPDGVAFSEDIQNDNRIHEGSTALKLNLQPAALEVSLSFFQGYHPMPGLVASVSAENGIEVAVDPYRTQIIGIDFSTTIGSFGLRGEFAYAEPVEEETGASRLWQSIPNPQTEYVIGLDREIGSFSIVFQYIGKTVSDFEELEKPKNDATGTEIIAYEVALWNRILSSQLKEQSDSVSVRPAWTFLNETLKFEMLGFANFSTEESFLVSKLIYSLADDFSFTFGFQAYNGPDETLYGTIDKERNTVFSELKASF